MGSRLRELKQEMGSGKLEDGKTLGRLTHAAINEIQNYYGLTAEIQTVWMP